MTAKPELLAPAGDEASFSAAVANGADAIYLGLSGFNARIKAQNFNAENISEYVRRAHFFGVKVYITLNTLVTDGEFEEVLKLAKAAAEAKADAFIVQDLGVARVLKRVFKNVVLHASTQLGVHNLYGALAAQKLGFSRVVLSRETKLADIKAIKQNTDLEIEYFVQGALCVAFSGNCYLSGEKFGDSGNRGVCRQLCRMPYTAESNGKKFDGYLLSARDLCLIDNLKELREAGVSSFKIEGRLRRPAYVAEAADCYRRALDTIYNGEKSDFHEEKERLKKVFNRGDYLYRAYLDKGVCDGVVNKSCQNHQGVKIGKIKEVKPFKDIFAITLESSFPISNGDGLKLFENGTEVGSLGAGGVQKLSADTYAVYSKFRAKAGQTVNLILDSMAEAEALKRERFVPISFRVEANSGKNLQIHAVSGKAAVSVRADFVCEKAQKKATDAKEIANQVEKVSDSGFYVEKTEIETDGVFLPKSVLNSLRREALEKLKNEVIEKNQSEIRVEIDEAEYAAALDEIANAKPSATACGLNYVYSDAIQNTLDDGAINVICPNDYTESEIEKLVGSRKGKLALNLPTVANGDDLKLVEKLLSNLAAENIKFEYLVSNNIYGLHFAGDYKIIAGFGHNLLNFEATEALKSAGACAAVPSAEIGCISEKIENRAEKRVKLKSALPLFAAENFRLPLMTLSHCPYKTVYGNKCGNCAFGGGLSYAGNGSTYRVRRVKLSQCYFELIKEV